MIKWFAQHPTAPNLLMLAIAILGLISLSGQQRETFPRISNDKVSITVIYPGATTAEVEDALCRRVEDALESLSDLDEMICDAAEGVATTTAVMTEGSDMMRFLDDVKSAIDTINDFPDQTEKPVIQELARTDRVISIAITGPDDPVMLKAYAENLKLRLLAQAEIANVEIDGFSDHQIRVEIPAERLRQFNLSLADLATIMQNQSVSTPAGRLQGPQEDILLRFDDQRKTVDEVGDLIVVSSTSGAAIRLREIASITDRFDLDENRILFNGKRAAFLTVSKTPSQDILTAYQDVANFVQRENRQNPESIHLTLTQDVASIVSDRLNMIVRNSFQGLAMVFLILWLFFSFRYSFWVTMGLPISFLGTLFLLPILGITINMISMVGLLIGIGLLMDDAIVIAENIAARLNQGERAIKAAVNGVYQVMPGILSSFATTVLVFGSLSFISGDMGQILRILPMVLIIVLSVSLIEAFFILPNHLGHSLEHMSKRELKGFRLWFESAFDRFRDQRFGPLLDRAVDYRYLTLGIVIMLMILSVALPAGGFVKFVGFPKVEGNIAEARVLLPQGTPLQLTESLVERIQNGALQTEQELSKVEPQPLLKNLAVVYGQNPDANESGPHVARVIIDLVNADQRTHTLDEFVSTWRDTVGDLPDVINLTYTEPTHGPAGRALEVRLLGQNLDQLKQASTELQDWFRQYAGVVDITDDLRPGKRELNISLLESAGALEVNARSVANQIRAAFQGITIDEFPVGSETYEIDLRLAAQDRMNIDDLRQLTITGPSGAQIPLTNIAQIEEQRGWARISRVDRQRSVTVFGDVQRDIANSRELVNMAARDIFPSLKDKYSDITIDTEGESESSAKTGKSIVRNVLLGLIGVYMLLAFQFRGYLAPLSVMVVIPTALIGVVFGHFFLGLDLTMPSIVGMASLFGVVVNDSILLVVFIREERRRGIHTVEAAKQAARARFRPILLTSITTIAGLTPLLLETSLQAQILIPLAASLAFGLTSATITALFLVPAIYCILDDFNLLGEIQAENDDTKLSSPA
jgi:multidrug efflux pump subunit AcrB